MKTCVNKKETKIHAIIIISEAKKYVAINYKCEKINNIVITNINEF